MIRTPRTLLLLALLALTVPAAAYSVRLKVYFKASFDDVTGAPGAGTSPPADVGLFSSSGAGTIYSIVDAPGGGGELKIEDDGTFGYSALEAEFKKPFKGNELHASFVLRGDQTNSDVGVLLVDDNDSGMIDVGWTGNGNLIVGGSYVGDYQPDTPYSVGIVVRDSFAGPNTWVVSIEWGDGELIQVSGILAGSGPVIVESLRIERPAGVAPGAFYIDDIQAVSYGFSANGG